MKFFGILASTAIFAALAACGGGGGGTPAASGPVASSDVFQLRQALANDFSDTKTYPFKLSGTSAGLPVTGSGSIFYSSITTATFEGAAARQKSQTVSATVTVTGPTGPVTSSVPSIPETVFVDSSSVPIGFRKGTTYALPLTPLTIPVTAKVGDTGGFGTVTVFSSSSKTVTTGFNDYSFSLTADTASTAILNINLTQRDSTGATTGTQVSSYRVTPAGSISPLAITGTAGTGTNTTTLTFTF